MVLEVNLGMPVLTVGGGSRLLAELAIYVQKLALVCDILTLNCGTEMVFVRIQH